MFLGESCLIGNNTILYLKYTYLLLSGWTNFHIMFLIIFIDLGCQKKLQTYHQRKSLEMFQ